MFHGCVEGCRWEEAVLRHVHLAEARLVFELTSRRTQGRIRTQHLDDDSLGGVRQVLLLIGPSAAYGLKHDIGEKRYAEKAPIA